MPHVYITNQSLIQINIGKIGTTYWDRRLVSPFQVIVYELDCKLTLMT